MPVPLHALPQLPELLNVVNTQMRNAVVMASALFVVGLCAVIGVRAFWPAHCVGLQGQAHLAVECVRRL